MISKVTKYMWTW